jgi:hypothetical protein
VPPRLPAGLATAVRDAAGRPGPPFLVAAVVAVAGAALVAVAVSLAAERSAAGRAEARAAGEAASFARHSAVLATGDAFGGYIQLLRDADDREVRESATPSDVRTAALRRLLGLNTNRFSGLAVVGLDGRLVAATDTAMLDAAASPAFAAVRANQGNANSDILLDADGKPAYVDYASILAGADGEKWGVLVARAGADMLWQTTLASSIDGGRNVIINREGQLAAGVPGGLLGAPWRGRDVAGGAIRARIAGVDSICGLAAIAPGTQIDHEWNVASCLPASTVLAGAGAAGNVWLTGIIAFAAAGIVSSGLLRVFARPAGMVVVTPPRAAPELETDLEQEAEPEEPPAPSEPLDLPPNVDARTLIAAYEDRNARLAGRVRESVQARLLVASSRVEEASQLFEDSPDLARVMLERAGSELDDLNEHELRALGQELYPDLVRLGLPAALRSLRKDVTDLIDVEVDAEAAADSVDDTSERAIGTPRRIVMYRLVLDALRVLAAAGLEACTVSLRRNGDTLWLSVKGHGETGPLDERALAAGRLAAEAHGGRFRLDHAADSVQIAVEFDHPLEAAAQAPSGAGDEAAGANEGRAEAEAGASDEPGGTPAPEEDGGVSEAA